MGWIIAWIVLSVVCTIVYRKLRKRYIHNYNEMFEEKYPRRRIQRLADKLDIVTKYDTKNILLFEDSYKRIDKYEHWTKE